MTPRQRLALIWFGTACWIGTFLVGIVHAQAQQQSPIFNLFCNAVRLGLANGPQASQCGLLGQGNGSTAATGSNSLTNPFGSNNPFSSLNPLTCPSGTQLSGNTCVTICTTPNSVVTLIVANAGPAQTVSPGTVVTLNGAGSAPSIVVVNCQTQAGTITTYTWTQTSGTTVNMTGSNTATPTFIAPEVASSLSFSLVVSDSNGQTSNPASVIITVT